VTARDTRTGRFTAFRSGMTVRVIDPASDSFGLTGRILRENGNTGDSFQVMLRANGQTFVKSYGPGRIEPVR
jgi:hypothetical protein